MAQYGNNKRRLKGLSAEEQENLKWLSYACRALYNTSLGFVRAEIEQNGLPAYSATHRAVIRTTEEYRRLGEAYESVSDLARVNCVVSIRTKRPLPAEKKRYDGGRSELARDGRRAGLCSGDRGNAGNVASAAGTCEGPMYNRSPNMPLSEWGCMGNQCEIPSARAAAPHRRGSAGNRLRRRELCDAGL